MGRKEGFCDDDAADDDPDNVAEARVTNSFTALHANDDLPTASASTAGRVLYISSMSLATASSAQLASLCPALAVNCSPDSQSGSTPEGSVSDSAFHWW